MRLLLGVEGNPAPTNSLPPMATRLDNMRTAHLIMRASRTSAVKVSFTYTNAKGETSVRHGIVTDDIGAEMARRDCKVVGTGNWVSKAYRNWNCPTSKRVFYTAKDKGWNVRVFCDLEDTNGATPFPKVFKVAQMSDVAIHPLV